MGASEGNGWPATADGSAETAGTIAGTAGSARAGRSRPSRIAVAAKPPNAAARVRASRVLRVEGACMRVLPEARSGAGTGRGAEGHPGAAGTRGGVQFPHGPLNWQ